MSLAERIKQRRISCGLSQEKVADYVGVSRQAVTKWESGRSAPSTENLFKLAQILGTTVDLLLEPGGDAQASLAKQIYGLYKEEEGRKAAQDKARRRKNLACALCVGAGYLLVYLAGRIWGTTQTQTSVLGWLFGSDPGQLSYLYGWLLHQNLFWWAMAVSVIAALFGKRWFSGAALLGFAAGLLAGELWGYCPAGAAYGHSHCGWAIWGAVFLFSLVMGILLEKTEKGHFHWKSKRFRNWLFFFAAGIFVIVLAVRAAMP